MKRLTGLMAAVVLLLGGNFNLFGQSVSYNALNGGIAPTTTDWGTTTGVPIYFPQFNPALGVLDEVILTLTSTMSTSYTLTNNSASPSTFHASTEVQIQVSDNANTSGPNNLGADAPQLDFFSATNSSILAGHASTNLPALMGTGNYSTVSGTYTAANAAALLLEFTGTGDMTLYGSTSTFNQVQYSGGNTAGQQATQAGLNGSVEYVYTTAPEPGTCALLVMGGLIAVPFFRRQRS